MYKHCCKPVDNKCSRVLRNVQPWMVLKEPTLNLNQKICDSCRKSLSLKNDSVSEPVKHTLDTSMEQILDLSSVIDDNVGNDGEYCSPKRKKEDPAYVSKEHAINLLDKFLEEVGETTVDTTRLSQKEYCESKLATICTLLKKVIFCKHPIDPKSDDIGSVMLQQIKKKYEYTSNRTEKIRILTLVPQSWSISKTKSEFAGTYINNVLLIVSCVCFFN